METRLLKNDRESKTKTAMLPETIPVLKPDLFGKRKTILGFWIFFRNFQPELKIDFKRFSGKPKMPPVLWQFKPAQIFHKTTDQNQKGN
ncbi:MAG: hypothetical protein GXO81_11475 [Chlorobi bacterium]|nr:hypothetical protein [Chlorobiota bacterium]